jgi:hypothetical protein
MKYPHYVYYIRRMKLVEAKTLYEQPLAGSMEIFDDKANCINFLNGLILRLRLWYTTEIVRKLSAEIFEEADTIKIPYWEYIINEHLYEFRRTLRSYDETFEKLVIKNWTKDLYKRVEEDAVLYFVIQVSKNREERTRE